MIKEKIILSLQAALPQSKLKDPFQSLYGGVISTIADHVISNVPAGLRLVEADDKLTLERIEEPEETGLNRILQAARIKLSREQIPTVDSIIEDALRDGQYAFVVRP